MANIEWTDVFGQRLRAKLEENYEQAEIMGEGRFLAAKADVLRQPTPWEAPLSTAGRAWKDSIRNSVTNKHIIKFNGNKFKIIP